MHTLSVSRLLAAAALMSALGILAGPALAAEKGAEIPNNAYYGDKLTPAEQQGIDSEETVTPSDGKASVPPADLQGVIPDAADPEKGDTTVTAPADGALPGDLPSKKSKTADSEQNTIINDSKKNFRVSHKDLDECLSQWGPDSQMTKEEWADSCRTTLQYFPEGQ